MRQKTITSLVLIMHCSMMSAKPLSEPTLQCCQLDQTAKKSKLIYILIQDYTFEHVVKKFVTILSWPCLGVNYPCLNRTLIQH